VTLLHSLLIAASVASGRAELPRTRVDITYPPRTGRVINVTAQQDLQAAIDAAKPGDDIALEAGATFTGPFTLPNKEGTGWVVIRSASKDGLPAAGRRVTPSDATPMPKLEASWGAVISAEPGAHHYRFVGVEIRPSRGVSLANVVLLGARETRTEDLPHHFIFDRCWIHGDPNRGSRRGVALGSAETAIIDSRMTDFKDLVQDSQAIAGWNGPGPYRIENNYLEGAGENVMFGGADPRIEGLIPSDIEILRNHLRKPLKWKKDDPSYGGQPWVTKNLFELKNARRVLVAQNLFEQNWVNAQNGFAILFTVRNQDGKAPWSAVEDVTFENNVVRHASSGINVLGRDDAAPSGPAARITVRNNLFEDLGTEKWGGDGRLFQILSGAVDVAIVHNTAFQTGNIVTADGAPNRGFVYRDNIAPHNAFGIIGTAVASGSSTHEAFFPGGVIRRNVIAGGDAQNYPPDNFFPKTLEEVGFHDRERGDYRLKPESKFRRAASDGSDVGADPLLLKEALGASSDPESRVPRKAESHAAGTIQDSWAGVALGGAILILAYANAGYPILLSVWGRLRPKPYAVGIQEPRVSIVVAAHNEAGNIEGRLENLLTQHYPRNRVEILLGLDGCDDQTVEIAKGFEGRGVRVFEFAKRSGKPTILNTLLPLATGDIVVLADARQRFDSNALRALVGPFADPAVGAVSGELILLKGDGKPIEQGLGLYWRFEKAIRKGESRVGSVVGATGAIYAIRKRLFEPLATDAILDDVLVPMRIARSGHRVVFEPAARAYDHAPTSPSGEFTRKVRTIAGNFQLFAREPWLLGFRNPLWLQTVSHKGLRLLTPLLLAVAFLANLALLDRPLFQLLFLAQLAFYMTAFLGRFLKRVRIPGFSTPYTVCLLAWATTVGFVSYLLGQQKITWAKRSAS
jgi:cellulose synthase/poly-beta-1,6-N-acetylglucosamine synthase-like glycosyltransferase